MGYLKSFILRLAAIVVAYGLAAIVIDPRQTGPWHVLPPSLVDDRIPKSRLFEQFAREGPVEGLVLGSSRSLAISPRVLGQLTGLRYFNFAVSAASIAEMASIYEYVISRGSHPRHIVIGLDVYRMLARRKVEDRQAAIAQGALIPRLFQLGIDLKSMYNVDFAHDLLMAIEFHTGFISPKKGNSFDRAGTLQHASNVISDEQYKGAVSGCAAIMHSEITRYDIVSDLHFAELNQILARASAEGAKVDIFTTPMNPTAEQQITEGTPYNSLKREVTVRLSREQDRFPFSIHDLAAPASLQAGASGWSDCVHFNEQNGSILVRDVLWSGRN